MSKVVQYKGGHGMGAPYDLPGYEYDAVNDKFIDLNTGVVFDKDSGSINLEDDKTAVIDVSAYTSPVEVTPTSGKDAMKKVTVVLSNIPSGGSGNYKYGYTNYLSNLCLLTDAVINLTDGASGTINAGLYCNMESSELVDVSGWLYFIGDDSGDAQILIRNSDSSKRYQIDNARQLSLATN